MAKASVPAGLPPRVAAAERLDRVLAGSHFEPLGADEMADSRDRALANRLVTMALRRHGHLDTIIGELLERGLPKRAGRFAAILRLGLAQLVYMPEIAPHSAIFLAVESLKRDPKGQHLRALMNAVLRRAQANSARYWSLPEELLIPEPLRARWSAQFGADAVAGFAGALLAGAPLDLTLRDDNPDLVAALGAEPVMADTVRITSRDRTVDALPGFAEGRWWVQDAAAAIPARLLRFEPGGRVLDLCAAPGGKTAQLCKASAVVTALDLDPERLERVDTTLRRLSYGAELIAADAATYRPEVPFDAVLLDAPCSATGTFRRHPEVLWHASESGVGNRVALQRRLLENAAACLRPGGSLVYCVCSLQAEEGEEQARWVAEALPQLEPDPVSADELPSLSGAITPEGHVRTHPALPVPGTAGGTLDGFFVARFHRHG